MKLGKVESFNETETERILVILEGNAQPLVY